MRANGMAAVVRLCWNDLPNHYPNVELDAFIIMPNHVHAIIVILDESAVGDGG
jgi:REP element-mobilizing transposase RayT